MWDIGVLRTEAIARSTTVARTTGLREVAEENKQLPARSDQIRRTPTPTEPNPTDMVMPAVSGVEIL
jgi:hypothetical protein